LKPDFALSPFLVSVVVTGVPVGTFFGALGGGWIANAIGRKRAMLLIALGYTLFSGLQGLSAGPWMLASIRLLLGLVVGISIVAAPQFIAESVPPQVRGGMLVTFQTATNLGVMGSYYVGLALASLRSWRLILALEAVPGVVAALVLWRLPDTARWYLMKGRRSEAERLLARVEPARDPAGQADQIEEDLRVVGSGSYGQLLRPPLRRAGCS
jgi:MFS family permease